MCSENPTIYSLVHCSYITLCSAFILQRKPYHVIEIASLCTCPTPCHSVCITMSNTLCVLHCPSPCVYYTVQNFVYHTLQCLHSGLPAAVNCCSPSPGQSSLQTPHHDHDHDYHHRHHLRHNDHHFSVTAVTLDPFCEIL